MPNSYPRDGYSICTSEPLKILKICMFSGRTCPSGYRLSNVTNTCYKWQALEVTWDNARVKCQRDGGDLVSLNRRKKFDEFKSIARTAGNIFFGNFSSITQHVKDFQVRVLEFGNRSVNILYKNYC